jgi:hypothetical protein
MAGRQCVLQQLAAEHVAVVARQVDVLPVLLDCGGHVLAQYRVFAEHEAGQTFDRMAECVQEHAAVQAAGVVLAVLARCAWQVCLSRSPYCLGAATQVANECERGLLALCCGTECRGQVILGRGRCCL